MHVFFLVLLALFCQATGPPHLSAQPPAVAPRWDWYEVGADRNIRVNLFLFWSSSCPHCPQALEFTRDLRQRQPWVNVFAYEISGTPSNRDLYRQMAASLNRTAGSTPAFFYCKQMDIGYTSYSQTGRRIESELIRWYEDLKKHYRERRSAIPSTERPKLARFALFEPPEPPVEEPYFPPALPPAEEMFQIPGWGEVNVKHLSLPTLTLVLAGCDSLNPCAFFVLLMLLSLLVHGRSRPRMLLVGGTFVLVSGLLYFLFMAAWLNLFFLVGHFWLITAAGGLVAIVAALLNIKDYFWFKQGPSLAIPDTARPGLFRRMTPLINVASLPALLTSTVALAFAANLYELLCTSGFPMIYTRVLTLRELPITTYYLYLLLYNVIYVGPMALIVMAFAWTLGARKLTENEGRILKLVSGLMMLALGVILIFRPEILTTLKGALAIVAVTLALTGLIITIDRRRSKLPPFAKHDQTSEKRDSPGQVLQGSIPSERHS